MSSPAVAASVDRKSRPRGPLQFRPRTARVRVARPKPKHPAMLGHRLRHRLRLHLRRPDAHRRRRPAEATSRRSNRPRLHPPAPPRRAPPGGQPPPRPPRPPPPPPRKKRRWFGLKILILILMPVAMLLSAAGVLAWVPAKSAVTASLKFNNFADVPKM